MESKRKGRRPHVPIAAPQAETAPARSPTRPPQQFMLWVAGWGSGLVPLSTIKEQTAPARIAIFRYDNICHIGVTMSRFIFLYGYL
jgi:hypothetical protein